jgi:hypothetical protein
MGLLQYFLSFVVVEYEVMGLGVGSLELVLYILKLLLVDWVM